MCENQRLSPSLPADHSDHLLSNTDLRRMKSARSDFSRLERLPITLVLDRVRQNYNIGAMFRLCDAIRVKQLVICGTEVNLRKRKLVQAARGTQKWVPWVSTLCAASVVSSEKARGTQIVVGELTNQGVPPEQLKTSFPVCLVLGSERDGVCASVVATSASPLNRNLRTNSWQPWTTSTSIPSSTLGPISSIMPLETIRTTETLN